MYELNDIMIPLNEVDQNLIYWCYDKFNKNFRGEYIKLGDLLDLLDKMDDKIDDLKSENEDQKEKIQELEDRLEYEENQGDLSFKYDYNWF